MTDWNKKLNKAIGEVFDYPTNKLAELVQDIFTRIDEDVFRVNNQEEIEEELDMSLDASIIWFDQEWEIARKYYSSPKDLNWDNAMDWFYEDLLKVAKKMIKE